MRPPDRDILGLLPEDDCPGFTMLLAAGRIPSLFGEPSLRRRRAEMVLVSTTAVRPSGCASSGRPRHSTRSVIDRRSSPSATPFSSERGKAETGDPAPGPADGCMLRPSSGGRWHAKVGGHPIATGDGLRPFGERGSRSDRRVAANCGAEPCRTSSEVQRGQARWSAAMARDRVEEVSPEISAHPVSCCGAKAARGL